MLSFLKVEAGDVGLLVLGGWLSVSGAECTILSCFGFSKDMVW